MSIDEADIYGKRPDIFGKVDCLRKKKIFPKQEKLRKF